MSDHNSSREHRLPKAISMAPYDSVCHPTPGLVSILYPMVHILEMRLEEQSWIKYRLLVSGEDSARGTGIPSPTGLQEGCMVLHGYTSTHSASLVPGTAE